MLVCYNKNGNAIRMQAQNAKFTGLVDLKLITALQCNTKGDILKNKQAVNTY